MVGSQGEGFWNMIFFFIGFIVFEESIQRGWDKKGKKVYCEVGGKVERVWDYEGFWKKLGVGEV